MLLYHFSRVNKDEKRYKKEIVQFGSKLKELRESQNMTQLDLELASGINRTEISRIENGQNNIEFFTIVKLAEALQINIYKFFN